MFPLTLRKTLKKFKWTSWPKLDHSQIKHFTKINALTPNSHWFAWISNFLKFSSVIFLPIIHHYRILPSFNITWNICQPHTFLKSYLQHQVWSQCGVFFYYFSQFHSYHITKYVIGVKVPEEDLLHRLLAPLWTSASLTMSIFKRFRTLIFFLSVESYRLHGLVNMYRSLQILFICIKDVIKIFIFSCQAHTGVTDGVTRWVRHWGKLGTSGFWFFFVLE